jgi:hypothetical protein
VSTIANKTITAANSFTDPVRLTGFFNLSISGTFVGTVTVQRSFDEMATWKDVDIFTKPTEDWGMEPEVCWYRAGVKAGEFTSGSIVVRLGQDGAFKS